MWNKFALFEKKECCNKEYQTPYCEHIMQLFKMYTELDIANIDLKKFLEDRTRVVYENFQVDTLQRALRCQEEELYKARERIRELERIENVKKYLKSERL